MPPPVDPEAYARRYRLDEAAADWHARAARFAAEVLAPQARDADRAGRMPAGLVRQLGAADLIRATLPTRAGGGGASTLAGCAIAEEIGAVDGSVRGFLAVQAGLVLHALEAHGSPTHRAAWLERLMTGEAIGAFALTEPEAGSDVGAIATTARRDGDTVVLDGEKVWITNGLSADVYLVFASVDRAARTRGLACYLVPGDAAGLVREKMPGRELGHRAAEHARLVFDGVRVPATDRLGGEREGFQVAMHGLEAGRLNVAAGAVGIHRAVLQEALGFARARRQFGRRIGDFQQVGAALADMHAELEAARQLVHHAARRRDAGADAGAEVSAAKLYATEAALQATTRALQILGSRGYSDACPVERFHRDAIALTIYEGTSNVQRVILARRLLGKDTAARKDGDDA